MNQYLMNMPSFSEINQEYITQNNNADYDLELSGIMLSFNPGEIVVIGGRPAMGKTTLMLQYFLLLAEKYGKKMLFVTAEHSVQQIFQRATVIVSQIPLGLFHKLNDEVFAAYPILTSNNCLIETCLPVWEALKDKIKNTDAQFVFVDYLQLFLSKAKGDERYQENKQILHELKSLAQEHQKVLVVASQLSMKADKRSNKIPQIIDLRKFAPLTEVASTIQLLYRPAYYGYNEDEEGNDVRDKAVLKVFKNNGCRQVEIEMEFLRNVPCFREKPA